MKRTIKKIIRILLILMVSMSLLTACTYKVYASSAVGVAVAGGSIGTGGAAVGLLGMLGPVTAILGVALASYGIYVTLDSAAEDAGMTKTDFLYEKFSEYNEQRNLSNAAMQDLILDGASILRNGAISISNTASSYLNGYINYMYGSEGIVSPDSGSGASSYLECSGFECPVINPPVTFFLCDEYPNFCVYDFVGAPYIGFRIGTAIYFATNKSGLFSMRYSPDSRLINIATRGVSQTSGLYWAGAYVGTNCPFPDVSGSYSSPDAFLRSVYALDFDSAESVGGGSALVGNESVYNELAGTLAPADGENTVFTPPVTGAVSGSGTISVPDYLDAINSILNTGSADISLTDPITGVQSIATVTDIDLTDTVPTVETEEEQETVGTTAVVNPDAPLDPDVDTVNSLAFDLTEIFPFCIPFDMYDLLSKFVADPVAPYWEISIPLPLDLPAIEFDIDFSDFETVAVILRSFEMVLFVGSLAIATRSIYLRG